MLSLERRREQLIKVVIILSAPLMRTFNWMEEMRSASTRVYHFLTISSPFPLHFCYTVVLNSL